ncbi:hypothetical protein MCGE09_00065 [Thaumarchaeota archaeon SCGC AB-539-E09]|nr:hypothetical protein MCGE09_00065 [Thaumarchaeota archaeon SCGC AB-539-E09]
MKYRKFLIALVYLVIILIGPVLAYSLSFVSLNSFGSVSYPPESRLMHFHSGRGILGYRDGIYTDDNILYCRMQLFAEINNEVSNVYNVLVPNGLGPGDPGGQKNDAWSEGGINYANLLRNIAYVLDNGMVPLTGLWITNIDPLENRYYSVEEAAPNLPMADENGYRLLLTKLNDWLRTNYPTDGYIIWEPCWEFNLYPWTNWGGAGGNRYWALYPEDYENAMQIIRGVLDELPDRRIYLAAHIVSWSGDEWNVRGKQRISGGDGYPESVGYMNGMELCDLWGISLYGEWDIATDNDVKAMGTRGYVDWLFEKIIKQCAEDPDLGDTFIGTFEYNMPSEYRDLRDDLLAPWNEYYINQLSMAYIQQTYLNIPKYFDEIKMLGWWELFGSDDMWDAWKTSAAIYEYYPK